MRTRWTDERLDELAETLRPLPQQVARLTTAVEHLTQGTRAIRNDLTALQLQVGKIGWALAVSLLGTVAALVGTVAALLVAL